MSTTTSPLPRLTLGPSVLLSLAAVYLIWSSTFLALRFVVSELPPLATSGVRFLLAGTILYACLRARGGTAPSLRQWLLCGVSGSLMFFVGNGFIAIAAREVPSGITALSIGTVPLFLTAMETAFGERPNKRQWAGIALGFLGVACMAGSTADVSSRSLWLLCLAPIGWASASLLVRRAALPAGLMAGAAQLMAGGACSLIAGLSLGERWSGLPSPSALTAFAYLVVLGSLVGYSAALHLLRKAPAAIATSYAYVNPVLALALGTTLAGEHLGPNTVLSGLLVVLGVALLLLNQPTGAARPQTAASSND